MIIFGCFLEIDGVVFRIYIIVEGFVGEDVFLELAFYLLVGYFLCLFGISVISEYLIRV